MVIESDVASSLPFFMCVFFVLCSSDGKKAADREKGEPSVGKIMVTPAGVLGKRLISW